MNNGQSAAEIIDRMINAIGGRTQADLSKVLEVSAASISAARGKGKIPPEWIVRLAISKQISPAWVKFGHGPQTMIFPTHTDSSYDKMTYIVQAASRFSEVIEVRTGTKKTIDYLIATPGWALEYFKLGLQYDKPSDEAKINLIRTTCWDFGVSVKQVKVPDKKLVYFPEDSALNLSEALDIADECGEDMSRVMEEYAKEAGAIIEEIKPNQSGVISVAESKLLNGHSIYELLNMASNVLESETIYKSSLSLTIMALYKASQAEEHLHE